jgi:hypothetical protein
MVACYTPLLLIVLFLISSLRFGFVCFALLMYYKRKGSAVRGGESAPYGFRILFWQ